MAINLDKIKASLNQIKNPSSGGQTNEHLLKIDPEGGEKSVILKIVPYVEDIENPFISLWFHYGVARRSFLCPRKMYDDPCPACDLGFSVLENYRNAQDEETKKFYKKQMDSLLPNQRVFVPVVVMNEEDKGVRFWGFSQSIHETLLQFASEFGEEDVDITDPLKSPEFKVTVTAAAKHGGMFNKTEVTAVKKGLQMKISALTDPSIIESCPSIDEIYSRTPDDEIESLVTKHVGAQETIDEASTNVGVQKNYGKDKAVKDDDDDDEVNDGPTNLDDVAARFKSALNKE